MTRNEAIIEKLVEVIHDLSQRVPESELPGDANNPYGACTFDVGGKEYCVNMTMLQATGWGPLGFNKDGRCPPGGGGGD